MNTENMLFIYPAKAAICPRPRLTPRFATIHGKRFMIFDGASVFLRDDAAHYSNENLNGNQYWIELADNLFASANNARTDEQMESRLAGLPEGALDKFVADSLAIAGNVEGYTVKAQADAAERRTAYNAKREADKIAYAEREAQIAREGLETARKDWALGIPVCWSMFEDLCAAHGITMPIQTIGSARKNVSTVNRTGMMLRRGSNPNGVHAAIRSLNAIFPYQVQAVAEVA